MPWEAGGLSPNQHASATPPRIWNIPIYGANIAAGLSGQKFERSKVCIRTENHTSANTSRFFVPWEAGGPFLNQHASATPPRIWSKHETGTVTKQTTGARGGFRGAVSKHETGTVTKQTTGARGGFASL